MNFRRAFTMVELLVVVAMMAILCAILLPVIARAKHLAYTTVDLSNLKQVGVGHALYAAVTVHPVTISTCSFKTAIFRQAFFAIPPIRNQPELLMRCQKTHSNGLRRRSNARYRYTAASYLDLEDYELWELIKKEWGGEDIPWAVGLFDTDTGGFSDKNWREGYKTVLRTDGSIKRSRIPGASPDCPRSFGFYSLFTELAAYD